jgi:hypothetical protein
MPYVPFTDININMTNRKEIREILQRINLGLSSVVTDVLTSVGLYTAQQNFSLATLTDAATISWNLNTAQVATVTLAGSRTLANPTNMVAGGTYVLIVKQNASGNNTLGYSSAYKWADASIPVLSTAANAVDVLTFVSDGTNMYGTIQKAFA